MSTIEVIGGKRLSGRIKVAGNKNAILPAMACSLLTEETCIFENVPEIVDVKVMAQLLELAGCKLNFVGPNKLEINSANIRPVLFPPTLTKQLRASVLLLGPLLARFGKVKMGYPGGDVIGRRPLDTHIQALETLGAKIRTEDNMIIAEVEKLKNGEIFLQEASVTATENVIMAASLTEGETIIKRAASEPHVVDLCLMLEKMGVGISGIGTNVLRIKGRKKLKGVSHRVRPDHIEVGTFAILAAVTQSNLEICPVVKDDLDMILLTLAKFGVNFEIKNSCLEVKGGKLKSVDKVVTDVWPGFPTDLMAPMIVLATQSKGVTILHDWMYESRMFFVDKLLLMGAKLEIADPHRVFVYGPTKLHGTKLDTPDIRAGIALLIAALVAKGKSEIDKSELIERGYEKVVERLKNCGAEIRKID